MEYILILSIILTLLKPIRVFINVCVMYGNYFLFYSSVSMNFNSYRVTSLDLN